MINFEMGLSIREIDDSLLVVKRDLSLPVAIQLNAFSGPALVATDVVVVVVVVVVTVDGSCDPQSNRSRFISRGEDDSVLFGCNDDVIVPIPPGAAHKFVVSNIK
jgi:hypothetical protein